MKTYILVILLTDHPPQVLHTQDCDRHIRILSEAMPAADLHCVPPIYAISDIHKLTLRPYYKQVNT